MTTEEQSAVRSARASYVADRWEQLSTMEKESAADAWRFLMLMHAGGAVAILSLMGSLESVRPESLPSAPLVLLYFVVGLLLVGIGKAVNYYRTEYIFRMWRNDVEQYYKESSDFDKLIHNDNERTKSFIWLDLIGWASFLFLIAGFGTGGYALWNNI